MPASETLRRLVTDKMASIESSTGWPIGTELAKSAKSLPAPSPEVTVTNRADSPTTPKVADVPAGKTTSPPGSTS